jgi:hypothetical protein
MKNRWGHGALKRDALSPTIQIKIVTLQILAKLLGNVLYSFGAMEGLPQFQTAGYYIRREGHSRFCSFWTGKIKKDGSRSSQSD